MNFVIDKLHAIVGSLLTSLALGKIYLKNFASWLLTK